MTDLRSAVVRLLNEVHDLRLEGNNPSLRAALADVRDALAHPAPPAEGEVGEVSDEELEELAEDLEWKRLSWQEGSGPPFLVEFARAVLAKYGTTPVPTTVPVSERLPEPEDCDAMGRCWWFCPPDFMELRSHATAESAFVAGATHWLPANSLPLPAGEVQP